MKKVISVLLAVVLALGSVITVLAATDPNKSKSQVPIIRISGDGIPLYDSEGNKIFHYKDILSSEGALSDSEVYKKMAETLLPAILKGITTDNWDDFYNGLETEISTIFANSLLDENGNVPNGSGLSQERIDLMEHKRHNDQKSGRGYYRYNDYWFYYDWRLDPMETADMLNSYIKDIKASTGSEKVGIIASCLGTNVVLAYVAKYGVADIQGIGMDGSVVGGAEILSDVICAKFDIAPPALMRLLYDVEGLGTFNVGEFVMTTLDMLTQTGVLEGVISTTENLLYDKLVAGCTSALALSTFYTWPNYWACVTPEDYESAKYYVFGKEGSEKRTKYAGLIEKLDNYDKEVRQRVPELLKKIKDDGANFGVISKYGFQIIPICATSDVISDQFASVKRSSFGATTPTVYETLSDEYIAQRVAEDKGKYISPDKLIDASTCIFPDYTWFIKGSSHSNWTTYEMQILYDVVSADKQLTVDDLQYTQFMVYDTPNDMLYPMTEENCNTEYWDADPDVYKPSSPIQQLIVTIKAVVNWFKVLIEFISEKA